MRETYDILFFIRKFEKLNDDDCITGKIGSGGKEEKLRFDCLGHCQKPSGEYDKQQQHALFSILRNPISIWDGKLAEYSQQTPRLRILAALRKQQEYQNYKRN